MTWEQKAQAMMALVGHFNYALKLREDGSWYVQATGRSLKHRAVIIADYGNGVTPYAAVLDDWERCVEKAPEGCYIVVNASGDNRRAFRWNGFMWQDVIEEG